MRDMATGAKDRVREEMGPDFDVDWKKLDPRQYDPRRIIREALTDVDPFAEPEKPVVARAAVNENSAYLQHKRKREALAPANRPRSTPRRPEAPSSRGRPGQRRRIARSALREQQERHHHHAEVPAGAR